MSIVTKRGDKGTTRTLAGEEISKADERLALTGALEELNAQAGFARSLLKEAGLLNLAAELKEFQVSLFRLGAEASLGAGRSFDEALGAEDVLSIESRIARHERDMQLPPSFMIPGAAPCAAALEVACAFARRLERAAIRLRERELFVNEQACLWMNRASDYLFMLARAAETKLGVDHEAYVREVGL